MDAFVLSINKVACNEMIKHLKSHGFGHIEVVEGVRPQSAKPTSKEVHECICEGHYKCTEKFSKEGKHPRFIVVEDDCRFTVPNAYTKIMEAVGFLDAKKNWELRFCATRRTPTVSIVMFSTAKRPRT